MSTYISVLRGINVGGKRKMLMADLTSLYETLGFSNVQTYIQSGNVIFNYNGDDNIRGLGTKIQEIIHMKYGYEVPVVVLQADELVKIQQSNPFIMNGISDIERLHLAFLSDLPHVEHLAELNKLVFPTDKFKVNGKSIYLFCAGKSSDSKLTNHLFERILKVSATIRNWKTVTKLAELYAGRQTH
jgi:uncharacterized protein (DUF1697 family)